MRHAWRIGSVKTGQVSALLPCRCASQLRTPTTKNSGSFRSWTKLRSESPASNSPVHWTITTGCLPPRCRPAATANASPSRQTRTSRRPGADASAASQRPRPLSGTQMTCVAPLAASAAATAGPSFMVRPRGSLRSVRLVAGVARLAAHLGVGGAGGGLVLGGGRLLQGGGVGGVLLCQFVPRLLVALGRGVLAQN